MLRKVALGNDDANDWAIDHKVTCGRALSATRNRRQLLFVGRKDLFLVVAALGVDFTRVEFGAAEKAEGGVVTGEHGVILVVVAVHAVAADGLEV